MGAQLADRVQNRRANDGTPPPQPRKANPVTELATRSSGTELTIADGQQGFTDKQVAALRQLGVSNASPADLAVFFHQSVRTGLDPFAKQIYMIERQGKQTIQTGIDGFRLIGRRAVDRKRESLSISDTEWCGEDGVWKEVWLSKTPPAAARVAVYRNGDRYPAIALFNEYAATKHDGSLNSMWASKPAGQLAKCAEALAWRKAFPQDLSGIYTADEMAQAENTVPPPNIIQQDTTPVDAGKSTKGQHMKISELLEADGYADREEKLGIVVNWAGREMKTVAGLGYDEAERLITEIQANLDSRTDEEVKEPVTDEEKDAAWEDLGENSN